MKEIIKKVFCKIGLHKYKFIRCYVCSLGERNLYECKHCGKKKEVGGDYI